LRSGGAVTVSQLTRFGVVNVGEDTILVGGSVCLLAACKSPTPCVSLLCKLQYLNPARTFSLQHQEKVVSVGRVVVLPRLGCPQLQQCLPVTWATYSQRLCQSRRCTPTLCPEAGATPITAAVNYEGCKLRPQQVWQKVHDQATVDSTATTLTTRAPHEQTHHVRRKLNDTTGTTKS